MPPADFPTDNTSPADAALIQFMAGDLQRADTLFRQALELAPNDLDTLTNFGALLQHRGHLREAARIYRQVLAQDQDEIEVRCNLAKTLADSGDFEAALAETDIAVKRAGGLRGSMATHGAVLIDARRYGEAEHILQQAIAHDPADEMTLVNLALCCERRDDIQAACDFLNQAVELNPHNARAVADLINCLSARELDRDALQLAEGFLSAHPGERLVIGSYAQALLNAGQDVAAHALTDTDELVQIFDLPAPQGFATTADFHTTLATELREDPSLISDPVNKATSGGMQTGELNLADTPVMRAFRAMADAAVSEAAQTYCDRGLATHPVMQTAATNWCLRSWGTLINAGGRQDPHMHPLGWLSAVYYVELPADMDKNGLHEGWLEFGKAPERFSCRTQPATLPVEPAAGRLVVFPSWLWHSTRPFTSVQQRISIAFDVMPLNNRLSSL